MKTIDVTAAILLVIGGLNWGAYGLTGTDLVAATFGELSIAARIVYGLVGLSALWQAAQWRAIQRRWSDAPMAA